MFYRVGKNSEKPYGGGLGGGTPHVRPRVNYKMCQQTPQELLSNYCFNAFLVSSRQYPISEDLTKMNAL